MNVFRTAVLLGMAGVMFGTVWAAPPMVQKHIFTPGAEAEDSKPASAQPAASEQKKPTIDPKLKQDIVFTGVIIGPKGKIALCREAKDKNTRLQKREGDTIMGLTVKRIEANYMLLADAEGKEMRFNVYQSDRKRPEAPPVPQPAQPQPAASAAGQGAPQPNAPQPAPGGASATGVLPGPGNPQAPAGFSSPTGEQKPMSEAEKQNAQRANAFKQAIEQAKQNHATGVVNQNLAPANPFQQAIQKALRP